jgi:HPr kinase/phosphorylase
MNAAVHGTAVAINGWAVLLTGVSGSGKSDLALRLIDRGAVLVGDDYVGLDANLQISPVAALAGKFEIRGLGVVEVIHEAPRPLRLLVELGDGGERSPESWPLRDLNGWSLPLLRLNAFTASAPIKIERALKSVVDASLHPVRMTT